MQLQVDIEFKQLLNIVKNLPKDKLQQLKLVVDKEAKFTNETVLENLLLKGNVATKEELATIEQNRTDINTWRKK